MSNLPIYLGKQLYGYLQVSAQHIRVGPLRVLRDRVVQSFTPTPDDCFNDAAGSHTLWLEITQRGREVSHRNNASRYISHPELALPGYDPGVVGSRTRHYTRNEDHEEITVFTWLGVDIGEGDLKIAEDVFELCNFEPV
jgi:hypothetical protein